SMHMRCVDWVRRQAGSKFHLKTHVHSCELRALQCLAVRSSSSHDRSDYADCRVRGVHLRYQKQLPAWRGHSCMIEFLHQPALELQSLRDRQSAVQREKACMTGWVRLSCCLD